MEGVTAGMSADDVFTDPTRDDDSVSFICEDTFCEGSFSPLWYCGKCSCTYCGQVYPKPLSSRQEQADTIQAHVGIVKYPTSPIKREKMVYHTKE